MKKKTYFVRFNNIIVWLLCILAFLCNFSKAKAQGVSTAIVDYSKNVEDICSLNPVVDFYYNKFISINDSSTVPDAQLRLTDMWNSKSGIDGKAFSNQGYASYRFKVILPPSFRKSIGFVVPHAFCNYKMFINGVPYLGDGEVGKTKEGSKPHFISNYIILRTASDTMDILIHQSNFHHAKAKFSAPITFGSEEAVKAFYKKTLTQDFFVAGCLFMATLFFFSLFLFNKRETAILWFALFTTIYGYRSVGSSFYSLHSIFPDWSFFLTLRLEYLSLPLSTIVYVYYVSQIYQKQTKKLYTRAILIVSFIYTLIIIFGSTLFFTSLLQVFLFILIGAIAYGIFVFIRAYAAKEPGSLYGLISFCFLSLSVMTAILDLYNISFHKRTIEFVSFIGFFLFQSIVLIHRFAYQLNKAKEDSEKSLQAKTDFLTIMSHEIRTPLNGVIGISELLQNNKTTLTEEQAEYIEALNFSSNNLLSVVNNILDYEKIEANKLEIEYVNFDLKKLGQSVLAVFKKQALEKQLELVLNYDESLPKYVLSDYAKITQVLTNLVNNAVKFTPAGFVGLSISAKLINEDEAEIAFTVSDSGIGINESEIRKIFEPFVQADSSVSRSFGGTGLGLTISAKLLQQMGSQLNVSSNSGHGSSFSFDLMVQKGVEPIIKTTQEEIKSNERFHGKRVLLVEDNKVNVLVAKKILERWKIQVDVALNGLEAIQLYEAKQHDLVLMDLQMPVMDGYEAAIQLRSRTVQVPIVALTANLVANVDAKVKAAGMNDSLGKPFKVEELERMLDKYLLTL